MINITDKFEGESYVKNCTFGDNITETLFTVIDGVCIASLDGYAIISMEGYNKLIKNKVYVVSQGNAIIEVVKNKPSEDMYESFSVIEIEIEE